MDNKVIIAVDFDGTLVDHLFPAIGEEAPGAFEWLKKFQQAGALLILWTMRSDGRADGSNPLREAVEFCRSKGIEFWGVNTNPDQHEWTGSPKAYAHLYIDDAAMGCPLTDSPRVGGRPVVDWAIIGPAVLEFIEDRT